MPSKENKNQDRHSAEIVQGNSNYEVSVGRLTMRGVGQSMAAVLFLRCTPAKLLLCAVFALTSCATSRDNKQGQEIACHNIKPLAGVYPVLIPTNPVPISEQPCSGSTLMFNGYNLADAHLDFVSNALFIRFSETDGITLMGFKPNDAFRSFSDTLVFNDETVCANDLIAKGFDLEGTQENNIILGTNATDRISGHAGNDTLNGGDGDDVYYYAPRDGIDCISDPSGHDVIEFKGGLSATNITAGISSRNDQTVLRLRLRHNKKRISKKDGIDVLLNVDGSSPIETLRFPDGSACAFSDIVRSAPKLPTSSRKTPASTTCFHDPIGAQQAGLVNARARVITLQPMPTPILDPTDSAKGRMTIRGSDGKPKSVGNKSVGQERMGE